ncbi:hypothetical protein K438DRAFT_872867 [Mycena galopus ATCC 62051]|nr:hypothetical protein K438DRAFT_872867 [Mycena galopus ATCC 62051]
MRTDGGEWRRVQSYEHASLLLTAVRGRAIQGCGVCREERTPPFNQVACTHLAPILDAYRLSGSAAQRYDANDALRRRRCPRDMHAQGLLGGCMEEILRFPHCQTQPPPRPPYFLPRRPKRASRGATSARNQRFMLALRTTPGRATPPRWLGAQRRHAPRCRMRGLSSAVVFLSFLLTRSYTGVRVMQLKREDLRVRRWEHAGGHTRERPLSTHTTAATKLILARARSAQRCLCV